MFLSFILFCLFLYGLAIDIDSALSSILHTVYAGLVDPDRSVREAACLGLAKLSQRCQV